MKHIVTLVFLALLGSTAWSQVDTGPEAALLAYTEASKSFDTQRMAGLMHPEALQAFREAFDGAFRGDNADRAKADLLPIFAVGSYEEYTALSDMEAFRRLTEALATAVDPAVLDIMATADYEVAGQVEDGDEVLVTYYMMIEIEGETIREEVVQRLKQHDGRWLLMLSPDSAATIAGIQAAY